MICKNSVHIFSLFNNYLANINEISNVKKEKQSISIQIFGDKKSMCVNVENSLIEK